jgi:hypothetical protein
MKTNMLFNPFWYITLVFIAFSINATAQQGVAINTTGAAADTSAILDVSSHNKGFLAPRMTQAERNAIAIPAEGLKVFNTTTRSIL